MKTRVFVLLLFSLWATVAIAAQSLSEKADELSSYTLGFRGDLWHNPAIYYHYTPYSWTDVSVGSYIDDRGAASLRQQGDKDTHYGFDVNSFVVLNERNRVFGTAGYSVDKQKNVGWNENIDWELVAPYVTGDSIGGFLNGETYYLSGGYAARAGRRWTWGLAAKYRAAHNYRDKDPRPYNTASDLTVTAGGSYLLGRYRVGVSADFRLYQQNSSITFLADKGSTSVYHMLGLGMDYVRFAGNQTGVKYQGVQWGAAASLLPVATDCGLSATVGIQRMSIDKKLTSANNLTLLSLATTDLTANVAWLRRLATARHIGLKLDAALTSRKGTENVYGEAGGSTYGTLISESPGVDITCAQLLLTGLWEQLPTDACRWGGALLPAIAYSSLSTDYKAVSRSLDVTALQASLRARLQYRLRSLALTAEALGGYHANLSADYALPGLNTAKSSAQTLLANINYLSDSYAIAGLSLKADWAMTKHYGLSLGIQYRASIFDSCGTAHYAACTVGIIF